MKSIRTFVVVSLLATMTLIVFLAALRGYRGSMQQTALLFDNQLRDLAELLDESPGGGGAGDRPDTVDRAIAFQVWDAGTLLRKSANAPMEPIGPFEAGFHEKNFGGHRWRMLARPSHRDGGWLLVAERADIRFHVAEDVILEAVTPVILGLPIAGLLIWAIVSFGMRPLNRLAAELATRAPDDLSDLHFERLPAELQPVVRSINGLLTRLAASFERERRFASDAAHELRTPISVLKVEVHNLSHTHSSDDPQVAGLRDGIERMHHVVEQILALHRTAPDQFMARFTTVDLQRLARQVIGDRYSGFTARQQQLELAGEPAEIIGDRFALTTMLENLLSNAGKYTPVGGSIRVTVEPGPEGTTLLVEDSGPGIAPAERERVFERFYRIGGDRHTSDQPGCGLGLAIVHHIATLHDATVTLETSSFGTGLCVRVRFRPGTPGGRTHV